MLGRQSLYKLVSLKVKLPNMQSNTKKALLLKNFESKIHL